MRSLGVKSKGSKAVAGVKHKGKARAASKPVARTKRPPSPSPASQTEEEEEVVVLVQEEVEEVTVSMAVEKPKARAARVERSPTPAEEENEEDEGMTQALGIVRTPCPAPHPAAVARVEGRMCDGARDKHGPCTCEQNEQMRQKDSVQFERTCARKPFQYPNTDPLVSVHSIALERLTAREDGAHLPSDGVVVVA